MKRIGPVGGGLILIVLLSMLRVFDPALLQDFRHRVFDTYQRLAPRSYQPVPVRVVDIDDASLARLGQWPWPRDLLARLIGRIGTAGAATIALDMVFAEADRLSPSRLPERWPALAERQQSNDPIELPDFDHLLAQTIALYPVVGGFALTDTGTDPVPAGAAFAIVGGDPLASLPVYRGAVTNLALLTQAFRGNGSFTVPRQDRDAVVRRLPLLQALNGQIVPGLSIEALRLVQQADTIALRSQTQQQRTQLERIRVGEFDIPVNADGSLWLHYSEPVPERRVPAWQILRDDVDAVRPIAPLLAGHIVLIGTSAVGLQDFAVTAVDPAMPGVVVHAQALEQMLSGWFLQRPVWAGAVELAFLIALGLLLVVLMPRLGPAWCALIAVIAIALAAGICWLGFERFKLLLDPVFPVLAILAIYLLMSLLSYIRTEIERSQIRRAFAQYLAPELLQQLEQDPKRLRLGGEVREMTFLFTDIAGFTQFTETTPPERLVGLLNRYLDGVCNIVIEHGGYIDKMIGDAVFAIFNAPSLQADHAQRAVRCALAIDRFTRTFTRELREQNIDFGKTRIGVNSGMATVGNFGGKRRFDYTALGDAVNTAARLEAANKQLGTSICIAETTVAQCGRTQIAFRPLGTLLLRGKSTGVEAFEPFAGTDVDAARLARYQDAYRQLRRSDPDAAETFRRLAADYPDDPVIVLHRRRLDDGCRDSVIRVS